MEGPRRVWLEALEYHRRGWSVFPMKMSTKRPAVRWKRFQTVRASEGQLHKWFDRQHNYGVAVIFGPVSGGLVSRDFDELEVYEAWAEAYPDLAATLPTVLTRRGRHVYARATAEHVQELRWQIGKPEGTGAILVAGGELRCGVGCYCVLPPSIHESDHVYRWLVPLPEGPLPEVDLVASGFYAAPAKDCKQQKSNRDTPRTDRRGDGAEFLPAPSPGRREFPSPTQPARIAKESSKSEPCNREHRENGEHTGRRRTLKSTEAISGTATENQQNPTLKKGADSEPALQNLTPPKKGESAGWSLEIKRAIADSLPTGPGKRHRQVFELARSLKAVPELADASAERLLPYVRRWHQMAIDKIITKHFEETWIDFLKGWPRVKYPKGEDALSKIFERSKQNSLPDVAENYEQPRLRLLVGLCCELQRTAGKGPFYLACRTAGRLLGVDHTTANRWLFLLVSDGVLVEVEKGDRTKRQATRFRYLGRPLANQLRVLPTTNGSE